MRPKLESISFPLILAENQNWLEKKLMEEEAEKALMECGRDKAPEPYGFNFCFIKAGWDFLKKNFIDFFKEFHQRGRLNKAINATFLMLIPKMLNPLELRDYRPISLVDCVYKLLSRVLTNRLKSILRPLLVLIKGLFGGIGKYMMIFLLQMSLCISGSGCERQIKCLK